MRLLRTTGSTFVTSIVLIMALAACESGAPAATTPGPGSTTPAPDVPEPPQPTPTADSGAATPAPQPGGGGTFAINGTQFTIDYSRGRCIDGNPEEIDLYYEAAQTRLLLWKWPPDSSGEYSVDVEVGGNDFAERFGDHSFTSNFATVTEAVIAGDRFTGSATGLGGDDDPSKTVDVVWDVIIPADAMNCG